MSKSWSEFSDEEKKNAKICRGGKCINLVELPDEECEKIIDSLSPEERVRIAQGGIISEKGESSVSCPPKDEHYPRNVFQSTKVLPAGATGNHSSTPASCQPLVVPEARLMAQAPKKKDENYLYWNSSVTFQGFPTTLGELTGRKSNIIAKLPQELKERIKNGEIVNFFDVITKPEKYIERSFEKNDWSEKKSSQLEEPEDDDYDERIRHATRLSKGSLPSAQGTFAHNSTHDGASSSSGGAGGGADGGAGGGSGGGAGGGVGGGAGGDDGDDGRRNLNSSEPMEVDEEESDGYELNEIIEEGALMERAEKERLILLGDIPGSGKTATLKNIMFKYKERNIELLKDKQYGGLLFVYYVNFGDKDQKEFLNQKLYDIANSNHDKTTMIEKLILLHREFYHGNERFKEELFGKMFREGIVVFFWDDIELVHETKLSCLLGILQKIKQVSKNIQWVATNLKNARQREIDFGVSSFKFVRLGNEKSLKKFHELLQINEKKAQKYNGRIIMKFQRLIEDTDVMDPLKACVEFTKAMFNNENLYRAMETVYVGYKLSATDENTIEYLTIKKAVLMTADIRDFHGLDVLQMEEQRLNVKNLENAGILKPDQSFEDFDVKNVVPTFLVARYFVDNLLKLRKKLDNVRPQEVELRLRLFFRIFDRKVFGYARKILIDYLLKEYEDVSIHEKFEKFAQRDLKFRQQFDLSKNYTKIFALHFFRKSAAITGCLMENCSKSTESLKTKLEDFLRNEQLRIIADDRENLNNSPASS